MLPYDMYVDAAKEFLWGYLQDAEYPPAPNHDGSNHRGFEVTTGDFWGHAGGSHYGIVAVKPDWQMYGK